MDTYITLLQNQSALNKIIREQNLEKKKKKNAEVRAKNYYGNSAEYKRERYKNK